MIGVFLVGINAVLPAFLKAIGSSLCLGSDRPDGFLKLTIISIGTRREPFNFDIRFDSGALITFAVPTQKAADRDHERVAVAHFESGPAEETAGGPRPDNFPQLILFDEAGDHFRGASRVFVDQYCESAVERL